MQLLELYLHRDFHYLINLFGFQVVFGNGLVLNKANLISTEYDDHKQFEDFITAIMGVK